MHFEVLVEDLSGKKMLDIIIPKIINMDVNTFRVIPYKGIGRIPRNLKSGTEANKRILLDQLPRLLNGYGKTFSSYETSYRASVIVVCDLDSRCLKEFRHELITILQNCSKQPNTHFCIAIEEGEAWFLGDRDAMRTAYPDLKNDIIDNYINDSICNTWELVADAIYPGGSEALVAKGWHTTGIEKYKWSENITPHINVNKNESKSFCYFRDKMQELSE